MENESENLIECCARYFQGAAYNTDSVDVCIAAIVKTLGVNLNLFMKDPVTKLMTLSKYDCITILDQNRGSAWMHIITVMLTHNITNKMQQQFLQ